jgi:sugar lactone lactonase YvrE
VLVLAVAALIGVSSQGHAHAAQGSASEDLEGRFGEVVSQIEGLVDPVDLVFDEQGRLFVLERRPRRIRSFDADGSPLATSERDDLYLFDLRPSRLSAQPSHLEVAHENPGGPIYFVDADSLEWVGGAGAYPDGAAAVARSSAGGIAVLSATRPALRWNGPERPAVEDASLEPAFVAPSDVAFLEDGALALVDPALHELMVFEPDGSLRLRRGDFGHFPGQLSAPSGIAASGDRIYIADTNNHRIQVRSLAGDLLYEWGKHALLPRQGEGHLHYPTDVAISPDGTRAAVLEPFEGRVQLFGPATAPAAAYRTDPATLGAEPSGHFGPSVAAHGRYAVTLEPETQQLHVHDLDSWSGAPVLVGRAGGYGARVGEFRGAVDVAFSADGESVWVLDAVDLDLSRFDLARDEDDEPRFRRDRVKFAVSVDLETLVEGLESAAAIAVDADDGIWIVDPVAARVVRVSPDLKQTRVVFGWDRQQDVGGPLRVHDLSIGTGGVAILVGDERLWRHVPGGEGLELVEERRVGGVDHDAEGQSWSTDRDRHRVEGPATLIGSGPGLGQLEFTDPRGLALTGDGRLVVVDHGNHRLQVLGIGGELLGLAGPRPYVRGALRPAPEPGARDSGED